MTANFRIFGLLLLLLTIFSVGVPLRSSTQTAEVTGYVYASGVPLFGAAVHLIDPTTGTSEQQFTDRDGKYTFLNVAPSPHYQITVNATGYAVQIKNVVVAVDDAKVVVPPFELKGPTRAGCEEPCPELISTTLGGVIDSEMIRTLPLVGRDFIDLTLLVPGTYPVEQGSVLQGASLVVNGARADMNDFLLDGADNNDYTINQSLPFQIVEALQEFRVQTSTSPAEFGRSGGAQINSVSSRGLNDVHGSVFEFLRNSALSADDFFSAYNGDTFDQYVRNCRLQATLCNPNGNGDPLSDSTLAGLYNRHDPQVVQNQFGANVGGPISKDRLFGFFNWESFRVSNPRPIFEKVPDLNLRNTSASFDPVAVAFFNLYPEPNVPDTAFTHQAGGPTFFVGESANRTITDNFLGRIDWRVSDRASMSFKHNLQRIDQIQGGSIPATSNYPGNGTEVNGRNQNFSYNYVQALGLRASNELRIGWNRFRLNDLPLDRKIDPATLGFQNLNFHDQGLPTVVTGGEPFTIGPLAALGADFEAPSRRANEVWSVADNLSYNNLGAHNWKFGGELRYLRLNVINEALGRGTITLSTEDSVATSGKPDIGSIARVSSIFGGGFDRYFRSHSLDGYVQDQWRPRSNFAVNFGVRYEVNTAPTEARNRLVNYYPVLGSLLRSGDTTMYDLLGNVTVTKAPFPGLRAGFTTDKNNWAPRFGLAWDPLKNSKTVVRGAYVLAYDQQSIEPSVNMLLNPPFVMQDFTENFNNPSATLLTTLNDTFSACSAQPVPGATSGCLSTSSNPSSRSFWIQTPYSVVARDPNTRTPYVHQFNLGVEQQFAAKVLVEVAYVGSLARRLPRLRAINDCTTDLLFTGKCSSPNGALTPIILNQENSANSSFHSLQIGLDARALRGLHLNAHYEFGKSIDEASSLQPQAFLVSPVIAAFLTSNDRLNPDAFAGVNNVSPTLSLRPDLPVITTRPRLPQDSSNLQGERGLSDFDVRHRFVASYIYSLPRWQSAGRAGDGWQLAGITTLQSGQPYTVFYDSFGITLRPDVTGTVSTNNSNPAQAINGGLPLVPSPGSSSAFSARGILLPNNAGQFLPGRLGRNSFIGAHLINFDFAVLKNTRVAEEKNLQLRVEFFNLFNNLNFLEPDSNGGVAFVDQSGSFASNCQQPNGQRNPLCFIRNPFFGQIIQARPAREIQFALKFIF